MNIKPILLAIEDFTTNEILYSYSSPIIPFKCVKKNAPKVCVWPINNCQRMAKWSLFFYTIADRSVFKQ